MKDFHEKTAVITGAASGIGRAIANLAASKGMKLILADIEETALEETAQSLQEQGAEVLAIPTDVSKAAQVENLADKTIKAFGAVHLLFNNAGVNAGTSIWESTLEDWDWILGVNLWGVIHGIRTFTPLMFSQDTPCHIVNTSSITGLISSPDLGLYKVTKHAVVSLSETLFHELKEQDSKVGVSVLCPSWVNTQLADSNRNRPNEYLNSPEAELPSQKYQKLDLAIRLQIYEGKTPEEIAGASFQAIEENRFYILTHPEMKFLVESRLEDLRLERNPTNPLVSKETTP